MDANELFTSSMAWLEKYYSCYRFFAERDIVWTLQVHMSQMLEQNPKYRVFHNHPMGERRSVDLAVLSTNGLVEVAAEFKYEPGHERSGRDIWPTKFPIVLWPEVEKDVTRTRQFVEQGRAQTAYAILIDESGYFRKQQIPSGSQWLTWATGQSVLWTCFGSDSSQLD